MFNDIFKCIEKEEHSIKKQIIEISEFLVSNKAMSPDNGGVGEIAKMEAIKKYISQYSGIMKEYPIEDKRITEGYRPNMSYVKEGIDKSKTIWLVSHIDVVPEGNIDMWDSDPFKLLVQDDKLIGRGVNDNHGSIVPAIILYGLLDKFNITPPCNFGIIFFSDEENGSDYGINAVVEKYGNSVFSKDDIVYVSDMPTEEGNVLEIAEKSILWLKINFKGKQGHGSRPDHTINAHKASAIFISEVEKIVKQKFDEKDEIFDYPYSSFEPTMGSNAIQNVNTIPGEHFISYDCRVLPCYKIKDIISMFENVKDKIEAEYKVNIDFNIAQSNQAVAAVSRDSLTYRLMERALKNAFNLDTIVTAVGGGTCAYAVRKIGIDAIVCGVGADDVAHQPNEYIEMSSLIKSIKLFAYVLDSYNHL